MNRGFISIGIAIAIALTAIVTAGGGYAVYKINELEHEKAEIVAELEKEKTVNADIVQATTTDKAGVSLAKSTEISSEESKSNEEVDTQHDVMIKQSYTPPSVPVATDVCMNIEGIQSVVPIGYEVTDKICTIKEKIDRCPNLIGVQETIPEDLIFYRNTNECLTDNKINEYENAKLKEAKQAELCDNATDERITLTQEIAKINEEYNLKEDEVVNAGGGTASGQYYTITAIRNEKDAKTAPLYDRLNVVYAEIGAYCN